MSGKLGHFYVGTSGYLDKHWRALLYPRGLPTARWLPHYADHFATVEWSSAIAPG